jgi:hypothetical protein
LKALYRAHELSADDWICIYFIGEVHSQMGKFHDAIEAFESILTEQLSEVGVLMSLAQGFTIPSITTGKGMLRFMTHRMYSMTRGGARNGDLSLSAQGMVFFVI